MKIHPRNLILNLLLAADSEPITARSAVAACELFGLRENSVRVALVRLVAAGLVETVGRGAYQLGPEAKRLAADVAAWRTAEQRVQAWQGGWIAIHVGGLGRSDRVALRTRDRALALLGACKLDRGLFLRPDNLEGGVSAARERLLALGLGEGAAVFVVRDLDEEREARARGLWDGHALSRSYRATRERLEAWLARADKLKHEAAARESFLLGNDAIRQLVFDPWLPEPLIDARERHAFVEVVRRFDRIGHGIWRKQLLLSARPAARATTPTLSHERDCL